MSNPLFAGAPALPVDRTIRLVYFRANPNTGLYPHDPLALLDEVHVVGPRGETRERWHYSLVFATHGGESDEDSGFDAKITSVETLWEALATVERLVPVNADKVYTIHAAGMLGRLLRWKAARDHLRPRINLQPPQLIDVVDAVNKPAVLSVNVRHNFALWHYEQLLGVRPLEGYDHETGVLLNLIKTYGDS